MLRAAGIFIVGLGICVYALVALALLTHAAELPIPRKTKVSVTMKREKGPAPVYKPAAEPASIDRPAGIP